MSTLNSSPRPGRREANKADKRARILTAARQLFSERGFDQTTTRAVAERADVAAGTVFLYAATKEELLFQLFSDEVERVQKARFASVDEPAPLIDQLLYVFDGFFRFYARDPRLSRVFLREQLFLEGRLALEHVHLVLGFVGRLAVLVEKAQARGELDRTVVAALLAQNLFALYLSALIAFLGGHFPSRKALLESFRASLELQLRGLSPSRARST